MTEYTVIYEWGEKNWSAYLPDLPGCIATGETHERIEDQIREAIESRIEGLREHGVAVPKPSIQAGTVCIGAG